MVSLYGPTEASDLTVKLEFYAALASVVDQYHRKDDLLILGDFIVSMALIGMVMRHALVPMGLEL